MSIVNLSRSAQAVLSSYLPNNRKIRSGEQGLDYQIFRQAIEKLSTADREDDESLLTNLIETLKILEPLMDVSDAALTNAFQKIKPQTSPSLNWNALDAAQSPEAIKAFLKDNLEKIAANSIKIEGKNTATVNFTGTTNRNHSMKIKLNTKNICFSVTPTRQRQTETNFNSLDEEVQKRISALHRIANNQVAVSRLLAS